MNYIKLHQFAEINMGQSPKSDSYNIEEKGLPFFQGNADFGNLNPTIRMYCSDPLKVADKGDVLMSVRAPIGAVNIANNKCCIGRGLASLKPKIKSDAAYLFYFLKYKRDFIESLGTGSTFKAISKKNIENLEIPEYNLETRIDIVKKMDLLEKIIDESKEEIRLLDEVVRSRFVEEFGDLEINEKNWQEKKISEYAILLKSGLSRRLSDDDIGLPMIRSTNIQNGKLIINKNNVKYWYLNDPQGANTQNYILDGGDLLVNFINSPSQIGKVCIFTEIGRPCIYTTNILRLKLDQNCDPVFFNELAKTGLYKKQIASITQPAVNQASFTTKAFLDLSFPIPPIDLQVKFKNFVISVDKSKYRLVLSEKWLKTLFKNESKVF